MKDFEQSDWLGFFKRTSERQFFFTLSKDGWRFNKGNFQGSLLTDLKEHNEEQLKEYLLDLYKDERCSAHTKLVLKEIMQDIFNK